MRRFETAERFWAIEQFGLVVRMTFGKRGTSGNRMERTFDTDELASAFAAAQIEKQVATGYREVALAAIPRLDRRLRFEWPDQLGAAGHKRKFKIVEQITLRVASRGGDVTTEGDLDDPEQASVRFFVKREEADSRFESECADARYQGGDVVEERRYAWHDEPALAAQCRESDAARGVYADWWIAQGDLRGELAALVVGGQDDAVADLLDAHGRALHGNEHAAVGLEFRHGFVDGVTITVHDEIGEDLAHAVRTALASPIGGFVERVRLGLSSSFLKNDWGPAVRAIVDSRRGPYIRSLRLDAYEHVDSEFQRTRFGDLAFAWSRLPALEELRIRAGGDGVLGKLDLPRLRTFAFEHANPRARDLQSIVTAQLPALESLELWLGSPLFLAEASVHALRPLLDGAHVPALRELHLYNCWFTAELVEALASSALLPRLRALVLADGNLARRAHQVLLANTGAFAHLDRLDLTGNYLTNAELERLAMPNIHAPRQHRRIGDEAPGPDDLDLD